MATFEYRTAGIRARITPTSMNHISRERIAESTTLKKVKLMDLHTRTVIEIAMINLRVIVDHQKNLTAYNLEGHPFEARQAAIALTGLGRLLLEDQAELEEFSAVTRKLKDNLVEFSQHETVR